MKFSIAIRSATAIILFSLLSPVFSAEPLARIGSNSALSEDQRILHVLNRLTFGARNQDIARIKDIGIDRFLEQQLSPTSIADDFVASKLCDFDILKMNTFDIFAKYPNPGTLLRIIEGNERNFGVNNRAAMIDAMTETDQRAQRQARRQKLSSIYKKYGFNPANQIMQQVQAARILRATYSDRQLEEVMVDFWTNHFNVYSRKDATRWYIPSYERDVIRKHALGNFRDLVVGTAMHPAMLFYLDNFQSSSPNMGNDGNQKRRQKALSNPRSRERIRRQLKDRGLSEAQINERLKQMQNGANRRNRAGINENYARELMELHTLGVDGGYTQEDIRQVAKAFTGWTIHDARGNVIMAQKMGRGDDDYRRAENQAMRLGIPSNTKSGSFVFSNRMHDQGTKIVLGKKIANRGMKDGLKVIDILVSHPATAKFIARKLAVKFVSDMPSEALIGRIAESFTLSNGDIKTTLRTLFNDPEFFAAENYHAKIKTPFELMISSLRVLEAETNGSRGLTTLLDQMGESLYGYQAPTGYPDTAADWVNTGALLERLNFAVALASNRIPQTNVDLEIFEADDRKAILENGIAGILNGEISEATKSALLLQIEKPMAEPKISDSMFEEEYDIASTENGRGGRRQSLRFREPSGNPEVFKVIGLLLGSPEFQRQ